MNLTDAEVPAEIFGMVFDRLNLSLDATPRQLANFTGVNAEFTSIGRPALARARVQLVVRARAFARDSIGTLSANHNYQAIMHGMRSFSWIEEVQQSILQMLKACPVLLFIEDGFTDALTRIMHAYPRNLQVQVLSCGILARKNTNIVTGQYCEMEPRMLCRALELFANNIRVARPAMQMML